MDEHSIDKDLRALRGADPAAAIDAPRSLRDRIAGIPAEGPAAAPVPLKPRRRWLLPAAAAAAVVAAIGGGYVWGSGGISIGPGPVPMAVETGTPDDPAAPVGPLDGAGGTGTGQSSPSAGGDSTTTTQTAASLVGGYGWGYPANRQRFIVPVFDETPAQAEVYAVDGRARYSAEDAARMAAELGVPGDVREFTEGGGGWIAGDFNGAHLSIQPWSSAWVRYGSGLEYPWAVCHRTVSPGYVLDGAPQATLDAFHAELEQCMVDAPMPTDEQARDALRSFLVATGVDPEATQITVSDEQNPGSGMVSAKAAWVVGSNATELVTEVWVSTQGLLSGSGPIGQIVSLGDYTIVSPAEGAARLNDPAYSPRLVSWSETGTEFPTPTIPTVPPEVPEAGASVPWPVAEREIVSARLGLALLHGSDGQQFLAPAYEFTADDDTVWSVIALAEDGLDTTSLPDQFIFPG